MLKSIVGGVIGLEAIGAAAMPSESDSYSP
jgi:hypothetical protein